MDDSLPETPQKATRLTKIRRVASIILGIAVFIIAGLILLNSDVPDVINLSEIDGRQILLLLFVRLLFFVPTGLMLALFTESFGVRLKPFEWFGLSIGGSLLALLLPGGAAMLRGTYLKTRHNLSLSHFSSILAASFILIIGITGFVGSVLLFSYIFIRGVFYSTAFFLLLGMAISPLVVTIVPVQRIPLPKKSKITNWLERVVEGWQIVRADKKMLSKQMGIITLNIGLQSISMYLSWRIIGINVSYLDSLIVACLILLANIVRITPGAVGVTEIITGVASELIGIGTAEGIAAAFLMRFATLLLILLIGPFAIYKMFDGWPVGQLKS